MNALLEFSPLLAFIVAYYLRDIYVATATLMVAMGLLLLADWLLTRRIPRMHLISTALVLVFGSATLILRSPGFIQWKPTIFMWLLAVAFLVSGFIGKQTLAQRLLQPALGTDTVPPSLWQRANLMWVVFYAASGLANIAVARLFSERVWVNFKVVGLTVISLAFIMAQAYWLARRASPAPAETTATPE
jgi:intracellular septation protein